MRGEIAKGAAWMILFRLLDRSIGLISTAVLARLLLPGDFGLVAMAMSVITILELMTTFGFEMALIQMRQPDREHFDTAWTLNVSLAAAGAIVTVLAAYPAAAFYGDPRLTQVMYALAAAWFLSGCDNIGVVNFRREMLFSSEFRLMATKRMITFCVTLVAAFTLRNYWALVIGTVSGRAVGVALSFGMHPFRPRFTFSRTRDLMSFSGWVLLNHFLSVAFSRAPHFYVGRLFGGQALGAYTVGAEIAQLAQTELIAPINRAMFPGYSRLQNDPAAFRSTCIDATALILLIALPVSVGIAVLAGPFVRLLLGDQWSEAVPIIQLLAISSAVSAITSNNLSVYLAMGKPYLLAATVGMRLLVLVIGLAWLAGGGGIIGVAVVEGIAALASLAVSLPTLFINMHIRVRDYLGVLWRPILASTLMGGAVWLGAQPTFEAAHAGSALGTLLLGTVIGAVVYPVVIGSLWYLSGRPPAIEVTVVQRGWAALKARLPGRSAS